MTKRNIILIIIFALAIALFATCTVLGCGDGVSPFKVASEEVEKEVEKVIWIEPADYTLMTKTQINNRISSLTELIEATKNWEELADIHEQAVEEFNNATIHLEEDNYLYPYTDEDFLLLSYMIQIEAGSSIIVDEEQCLVGSVIINRRNQGGINKNLENPTIKDIINEAGQYAICRYSRELGRNTFYVDVNSVDLSIVSDRCKENARKVLEGEFTCPENVVFQALFTQGKVYKSFYHEAPFNNTTYFCYGR